jgi:WD40 repeat protein
MMEEPENGFTPEAIDAQTEHGFDRLSLDERRLIQDVYTLSQAYKHENERSLERIWSRFAQSQEQALLSQNRRQETLVMRGKTMREDNISHGREFGTLKSQSKGHTRPPVWRTLGIVAAVAVIAVLVGGWSLLTNSMRHGTPLGHAQNTQQTQTEKVIHSGKLVCTFAGDNSSLAVPAQPTLAWSSQGQIASTYSNLKTFNAQNCAKALTGSQQYTQASWSPDGTRLLVQNTTYQVQVLDAATGHVISTFHPAGNSAATQSAWSADGKQVISLVEEKARTNQTLSVQIWDATTGAPIRTTLNIPATKAVPLGQAYGQLPMSADGKYLAILNPDKNVEIWDTTRGTKVSTLPFKEDVSALAWSPEGKSLALGLLNAAKVEIWSVADASMLGSFKDHDTWAKAIGYLAWSPDGKYLAESTSTIHLYDIKKQAIVATFGKTTKPQSIAFLAWSPKGDMLASSTVSIDPLAHDPVDVWQLS